MIVFVDSQLGEGREMEDPASARLFDHFAHVSDPRAANIRHRLFDIFVIALCAVISGAEGWEDMEEYGQAQAEWFEQFLDLPHGIPSPDTFRRVLSRLKPEELTQCFVRWTAALRESIDGEIIAIDGKTLRRSFDRAAAKGAIHMVSAWAHANRLVLGQLKVTDKSNEITAIPQLLRLLELEGTIVTIDAMGCQKEIAHTIVQQGADYVLALKDNHPTLHGEVQLFFDDIKAKRLEEVKADHHQTIDADHGRLETRDYWLTADIECLGVKGSWAKITSIGLVESRFEVDGEVSIEQRFFLTSLPGDAVRFAQAVRQHWGVENSLHWVLDVSFREDECRIRQDCGAQNLAVIRHMALNLLRQEAGHKRGIKARRKRAGWDRDYLFQVLTG
jgi:predicted transposase YbfD/YdcC